MPQGHLGFIHVLPALPAAWPSGSFDGLLARGGYTVGATWSSGRVTEIRLTARHPGTVHLKCASASDITSVTVTPGTSNVIAV